MKESSKLFNSVGLKDAQRTESRREYSFLNEFLERHVFLLDKESEVADAVLEGLHQTSSIFLACRLDDEHLFFDPSSLHRYQYLELRCGIRLSHHSSH